MTAPSHASKKLISIRALLVALHDVALAALAFELSVWVRYLTYGAPQEFGFLWQGTIGFACVAAGSFWAFGLYRGIWYYASFDDILAILKAVTIATLVLLPILFVMNRLDALPRSVLAINWLLLVVMLAGPRFLYRFLKDGDFSSVFERRDPAQIPVLVAGISDAADTFIRETKRSRSSPYRIVGLIDRSIGRVGRDVPAAAASSRWPDPSAPPRSSSGVMGAFSASVASALEAPGSAYTFCSRRTPCICSKLSS